MAYQQLNSRVVLGAVVLMGLASSSMGLASEEQEIFSLRVPEQEVIETGAFGLVENHHLLNASITEIRIDEAALTLPSGPQLLGYDFEKDVGIAIGVGDGVSDVSLTSIKALPGNQLEVVAYFEQEHIPVTPMESQVAVFDLNTFKRLDWSFQPGAMLEPKTMAAYVLADISGSMSSVFPAVKAAAKKFFLGMPNGGVSCSLTSFDHHTYHLSPQPEDCAVTAGRVDGMVLHGGGTDIFTVLRDTYVQAANDGYSHTLIIVLSDGYQGSEVPLQEVQAAKSLVNGQTLVLWLEDNYSKDDLVGLIDRELFAGSNVEADIKNYFEGMELFVKGQRFLHVKR